MKAAATLPSPFRLSAKALGLAALACAAAAAMVWGAGQFAAAAALTQGQAAAGLAAAELALENTQADRVRLEDNLQRFVKLRQAHFVEAPDRLRILEALENAAKDMRQSDIVWDMGPQENRKALVDDKTGEPVAQLVRVPLKLSAKGVHEEEWLTLLTRLQNTGAGYFAMESCMYEKDVFAKSQISLPAINATCNLSWLYVVPAPTALKPP